MKVSRVRRRTALAFGMSLGAVASTILSGRVAFADTVPPGQVAAPQKATFEERYQAAFALGKQPKTREDALDRFKLLYEENATADVLYNMASLERVSKRPLKPFALKHLKEWLERSDRDKSHEANAILYRDALTSQLSLAEIVHGTVTKVAVDGEVIGAEFQFWVLPGKRKIEAWTPSGHHQVWERIAKAGQPVEPLVLDGPDVEVSSAANASSAATISMPSKTRPESATPSDTDIFAPPQIQPVPATSEPKAATTVEQSSRLPGTPPPRDWTRIGVGTGLGAGAVGLVLTGIALELSSTSNKNAAASLLAPLNNSAYACASPSSGACSSVVSHWNTYNTDARWATGLFVAGGVLAAASVATFAGVFSPRAREDRRAATAHTLAVPVIAPNYSGVSLVGQF